MRGIEIRLSEALFFNLLNLDNRDIMLYDIQKDRYRNIIVQIIGNDEELPEYSEDGLFESGYLIYTKHDDGRIETHFKVYGGDKE